VTSFLYSATIYQTQAVAAFLEELAPVASELSEVQMIEQVRD